MQDGFEKRCLALNKCFATLSNMEDSPHVWASVISSMLRNIIRQQPDSDTTLEEVIEYLREEY